MRRINFLRICAFLIAGWIPGCSQVDKGVGFTVENDFTLSLEVVEQTIHIGDQTPLVLRLKRTDNSNLSLGMNGVILITTSTHGQVDQASVGISVANETTRDVVRNLVFTAEKSGVAEVRAVFREATASVKIMISEVNI